MPSPLEMSWTGKALILGFKHLELQTDQWRIQDDKPTSFGLQQLLSLTVLPSVTAIAPQHLHKLGAFFPLHSTEGLRTT